MTEERLCENCGITESEYGFEFVYDCQGEPMCEGCAETSDLAWKEMEEKDDD